MRQRYCRLLPGWFRDKGSFVETDMLAVHRTTDFGMAAKKPVTDGIVTGWGTIDGHTEVGGAVYCEHVSFDEGAFVEEITEEFNRWQYFYPNFHELLSCSVLRYRCRSTLQDKSA